jgi:hypothetical protein
LDGLWQSALAAKQSPKAAGTVFAAKRILAARCSGNGRVEAALVVGVSYK